ncbi:MAG: efflux RND transporter permease subunit [Pseudomonadales bacterium]|jgi:multidrug efflux pump
MNFVESAIYRTRTTLLIMVMLIIAGIASMRSISVEGDPSIAVPFFSVMVFSEGISPEDAERLLVMPLEFEVRNLEGVKEIEGYASENTGRLSVEFEADQDIDQALIDLREAVNRARSKLPSSAEEPVIEEATTADFPVLMVGLASESSSERELYYIAIDLKRRVEALPSVLSTQMWGAREEVLEVTLDPRALDNYGISPEALMGVLSRNNRLIPAGNLDNGNGRFSIKVPSVIEDASDLFDLPLMSDEDAVVTLSDVADIQRTFKTRSGYSRMNGRRAITLQVTKRTDANVIDTVAEVKALLNASESALPKGVDVIYSVDQSVFAQQQVDELQGNIGTALCLVMIVVVAALGLRSGIIVGLGIPVSLLFAITILYVIGFTYNFMVMFGLLLGLGMLIDGAIVVTEEADRRMLEGTPRQAAYSGAAVRMFWPVTASVATTLAAFLPLMFWPGMVGKFMRYLPVTVFAVLCGSLLYSLLFAPALGAVMGRVGSDQGEFINKLKQLTTGRRWSLGGPLGVYVSIVAAAARNPVTTIVLTLTFLFGTVFAYTQFGRGVIFFSSSEPQFMQVRVNALGNYSAAETNQIFQDVENTVLGVRGIATMSAWNFPASGSEQIGNIFMELLPENERADNAESIIAQIREGVARYAGVSIEVIKMEQGPGQGKPIKIQVASYDRDQLEPATRLISDYMKSQSTMLDVEDSLPKPSLEWRLKVDRAKAALAGADVSAVGLAVQMLTNGVKVGEYRPDRADDAVDIRVRYPDDERRLQALEQLRVATSNGMAPITSFVEIQPAQAVGTIRRTQLQPTEVIRANVAEGVLADDVVKDLEAWVATQTLHPAVTVSFRGINEEQQESQGFTLVAFGLALLFMFVLLVTQFNSFYQSALILFSVVLSTTGVFIGLLVTGNPFSSLLSGIGIVALAGIVVNNNIVLIDTFNQLRREQPGADLVSLVVQAGTIRLRPVVLTTLTTVFGLMPLALNFSVDLIARNVTYGGALSSLWVPLSQAIVWGLSFASMLTLVVTPAMLTLPSAMRARFLSLKRRVTSIAVRPVNT